MILFAAIAATVLGVLCLEVSFVLLKEPDEYESVIFFLLGVILLVVAGLTFSEGVGWEDEVKKDLKGFKVLASDFLNDTVTIDLPSGGIYTCDVVQRTDGRWVIEKVADCRKTDDRPPSDFEGVTPEELDKQPGKR